MCIFDSVVVSIMYDGLSFCSYVCLYVCALSAQSDPFSNTRVIAVQRQALVDRLWDWRVYDLVGRKRVKSFFDGWEPKDE